jgi:hypothetical protein
MVQKPTGEVFGDIDFVALISVEDFDLGGVF